MPSRSDVGGEGLFELTASKVHQVRHGRAYRVEWPAPWWWEGCCSNVLVTRRLAGSKARTTAEFNVQKPASSPTHPLVFRRVPLAGDQALKQEPAGVCQIRTLGTDSRMCTIGHYPSTLDLQSQFKTWGSSVNCSPSVHKTLGSTLNTSIKLA